VKNKLKFNPFRLFNIILFILMASVQLKNVSSAEVRHFSDFEVLNKNTAIYLDDIGDVDVVNSKAC
jgi:hypothetical protein